MFINMLRRTPEACWSHHPPAAGTACCELGRVKESPKLHDSEAQKSSQLLFPVDPPKIVINGIIQTINILGDSFRLCTFASASTEVEVKWNERLRATTQSSGPRWQSPAHFNLSVNVHVFVSPKHSTVLDSPVSCWPDSFQTEAQCRELPSSPCVVSQILL